MIYQLWYQPIHLTIFPSNKFSSPSNHTLLQPILPFPSNSLFAFFLSHCQSHVFSSICEKFKISFSLYLRRMRIFEKYLLLKQIFCVTQQQRSPFSRHLRSKKCNFSFTQTVYSFLQPLLLRHTFTISLCLHILESVLSLLRRPIQVKIP